MKKRIITILILAFLVAVIAVLFGAVFCLRRQSVKVVGENPLTVSAEEILNTAQLKNGSSIFFLDKDKAIENIEKTYADVKVVQIKTISLVEIEIIVRTRLATYYAKQGDNYYALDEDLKVIKITTDIEEVNNLIFIQDGLLQINEQTKLCDFVGGEGSEMFYNLYTSIFKTATKQVDGQKQYLTRQEVINMLDSVSIEQGNTLSEKYDRLIVKTTAGVIFDIAKPNENLENKINMCISAYESGNYDITKGTIMLFYNANGEQGFIYTE